MDRQVEWTEAASATSKNKNASHWCCSPLGANNTFQLGRNHLEPSHSTPRRFRTASRASLEWNAIQLEAGVGSPRHIRDRRDSVQAKCGCLKLLSNIAVQTSVCVAVSEHLAPWNWVSCRLDVPQPRLISACSRRRAQSRCVLNKWRERRLTHDHSALVLPQSHSHWHSYSLAHSQSHSYMSYHLGHIDLCSRRARDPHGSWDKN